MKSSSQAPSDTLYVHDVNEAFVRLEAPESILKEISQAFTFKKPGAQFDPRVQKRLWDGKIRLLRSDRMIYKGLLRYLKKFCDENNYDFVYNGTPKTIIGLNRTKENVEKTVEMAMRWLDKVKLPFEPHDYQVRYFLEAIRTGRSTFISPTSSGKSLIIYLITRFYFEHGYDDQAKILIVVPTTDLVGQMYSDFRNYSFCVDSEFNSDDPSRCTFDVDSQTHAITGGASKNTDRRIVISTWQSIYKLGTDYFDQYGLTFIDEAHLAKAECLKGIFEKSHNTPFRLGFTGTLDDTECNRYVIEGLLGPVKQFVDTKTLMDRGIVSELKIKMVMLGHAEEVRKELRNAPSYHVERDYIFTHEKRAKFLLSYAEQLKGNVLILTHSVAKHVPLIQEKHKIMIEAGVIKKPLLLATGLQHWSERDAVKECLEAEDNINVLASYKLFSTGISVNNIQHVIFSTPNKAMIEILQSIGRGLRLDGKTNIVTVHDFVDDMSSKNYTNYLLVHGLEREVLYMKNEFKYKFLSFTL
jgi:superfamily II DNA or RNA helicase